MGQRAQLGTSWSLCMYTGMVVRREARAEDKKFETLSV